MAVICVRIKNCRLIWLMLFHFDAIFKASFKQYIFLRLCFLSFPLRVNVCSLSDYKKGNQRNKTQTQIYNFIRGHIWSQFALIPIHKTSYTHTDWTNFAEHIAPQRSKYSHVVQFIRVAALSWNGLFFLFRFDLCSSPFFN